MNASYARRLEDAQLTLVALSAPLLLDERRALRAPVTTATAPLAESLTLRERFALRRMAR